MEDRVETTDYNCQSCDRPDTAENDMVQCNLCKLWKHFSCAGVDDRIKQRSAKYICRSCNDNYLKPQDEAHPGKGQKVASKTSSKRGKKTTVPPGSVSSSIRIALLEEKLKLVEEERQLKEQEILEQEEIRNRQLQEAERQLEEQRQIAAAEKEIRERKLQAELAAKRMQQQIRKESYEKRQEIIRQLAGNSSYSESIAEPTKKVRDWLKCQQQSFRNNQHNNEMERECNGASEFSDELKSYKIVTPVPSNDSAPT
ncbi:involucrin-like [Wyeomyia smithii]|uniref:involucrin-like n=1 Tax=Wyeomyia smithii TaxID=174621 RepID=UPI002467F35C|nr:involucrin-like [Wyeomyia smithii]